MRAGSEAALQEVFIRHSGAVLSLAVEALGRSVEVRRLVVDVFLRVWHAASAFDADRGCLRAYLISVTHRRAVELLRSGVVRVGPPAGREVDASHLACATRMSEVAQLLSTQQRAVIELVYFHGMTHRRAAELLDVPASVVKSRLRSALRRLQLALAADVTSHGTAPAWTGGLRG